MKSIIVYSGKGGVGKTTTTANLAKALVDKGKSVFILDADINTPSMHVVFPDKTVNKNLYVHSMGYDTRGLVYIQGSMVKKYIRQAKTKVNKMKPDIVLIDTPPSITDIHLNLIESLEVSGVIFVTQPNKLSMEDVGRTSGFFKTKEIPVIGIIENMSQGEAIDYTVSLLGKIKFESSFDIEKVFKLNYKTYDEISNIVMDAEDAIYESSTKQFTDESISEEAVQEMMRSKLMPKLKFVNLATWDYLVEYFLENDFAGLYSLDRFIDHNTTEKIGRMLKAFEHDKEAYFMVINAPCTPIPIITGEIGQATLILDNPSHYGVPSVDYQTNQGTVRLFPHEIMPLDLKELNIHTQEEGVVMTTDGRYLPSKETVEACYHAYGNLAGLSSNWEETYNKIVAE